MAELPAEVLAAVERGESVFPVGVNKKPMVLWKPLQTEAPSLDQVLRWQEEKNPPAWASVTGKISGHIVLDGDGETGIETLRRMGLVDPHFATGRGGRHVRVAYPGRRVPTLNGKAAHELGEAFPGVDVKGDGGYAVFYGRNGAGPYQQLRDPAQVEPWEKVPAALLNVLYKLDQEAHESATNGAPPTDRVASRVLIDRALAQGNGRNNDGFWLATQLRDNGYSRSEAESVMREYVRSVGPNNTQGDSEPYTDRDADASVRSAYGGAAREPWTAGQAKPEASADPVIVAFTPITARDLCLLPDPPDSDQLLGALVVRGQRLILGAHTGEGKTTMTFAMVRAITLGEEFLDWTGGGGRALVIDAEQGLRTIKRRLREAGLDDSDHVDYLRVPDGLSLNSDAAQAAALEQLLADNDYSIVVADPLYKLHTGDSNAEREAVDLMRRFDAWRERYRFALALPVHCRKPPVGAKFTMHEFFGSTAYLRGAEVVIGLQRVRDGYSRLHFFKDRDGDLPISAKWGLLFDREQGYRRDPDDETPKQNSTEQVRDLLEAQPGMTVNQLMAATGFKDKTIRRALSNLSTVDSRPGSTSEKLFSLGEDEDSQ